jgi:hypothetical protein
MHITLDQEQWEAITGATLGEVLADVSDRAQARSRIVTSLSVDQRPITDRDIDAALLAQSTARFTQLTASSQSKQEIMQSAQDSIHRYAELLRTEGTSLVSVLRLGMANVDSIDEWLGKLADYVELTESDRSQMRSDDKERSLVPWIQQLLDARMLQDAVRMADLLEYEILPRLSV